MAETITTARCEFFIDVLDGSPLEEADYQSCGLVGTSYYGGPIAWIDWTRVERVYCDTPAPVTIAGETDSFGTEWIDTCASCLRGGAWRE